MADVDDEQLTLSMWHDDEGVLQAWLELIRTGLQKNVTEPVLWGERYLNAVLLQQLRWQWHVHRICASGYHLSGDCTRVTFRCTGVPEVMVLTIPNEDAKAVTGCRAYLPTCV